MAFFHTCYMKGDDGVDAYSPQCNSSRWVKLFPVPRFIFKSLLQIVEENERRWNCSGNSLNRHSRKPVVWTPDPIQTLHSLIPVSGHFLVNGRGHLKAGRKAYDLDLSVAFQDRINGHFKGIGIGGIFTFQYCLLQIGQAAMGWHLSLTTLVAAYKNCSLINRPAPVKDRSCAFRKCPLPMASTDFPCRWLVGTWALVHEIVSSDSVMISWARQSWKTTAHVINSRGKPIATYKWNGGIFEKMKRAEGF